MSNDDRSTSPISVPPSNHQRRGSVTSGLFGDFLNKPGHQGGSSGNNQSSAIVNAAANAQSNQRRRMSITTLGLSGSPNQTSPYAGKPFRRGSMSSSVGSNGGNAEDAVMEDNENVSPSTTPSSSFARRVSFGAQALRDARAGSMGNGKFPSSASDRDRRSSIYSPHRSPPSAASRSASVSASASANSNKPMPLNERSDLSWRQPGEGFNWSEALRNRAERDRAPSFSGGHSPPLPQGQHVGAGNHHHQRSASIASMEQPAKEIPKRPKQDKKPDFFQEKILRGDFMD